MARETSYFEDSFQPLQWGLTKRREPKDKRCMRACAKATKEAIHLPKMSRSNMKAAIPSMKEIDQLVVELLHSKGHPETFR